MIDTSALQPTDIKAMAGNCRKNKKLHIFAVEYSDQALKAGIEIEMEHTDDPEVAKKIAIDHLEEHPLYYDKEVGLPKMEEELKNHDWDESKHPREGGKFAPKEGDVPSISFTPEQLQEAAKQFAQMQHMAEVMYNIATGKVAKLGSEPKLKKSVGQARAEDQAKLLGSKSGKPSGRKTPAEKRAEEQAKLWGHKKDDNYDWDESKHPREGGKFAPKDGGTAVLDKPVKSDKSTIRKAVDTLKRASGGLNRYFGLGPKAAVEKKSKDLAQTKAQLEKKASGDISEAKREKIQKKLDKVLSKIDGLSGDVDKGALRKTVETMGRTLITPLTWYSQIGGSNLKALGVAPATAGKIAAISNIVDYSVPGIPVGSGSLMILSSVARMAFPAVRGVKSIIERVRSNNENYEVGMNHQEEFSKLLISALEGISEDKYDFFVDIVGNAMLEGCNYKEAIEVAKVGIKELSPDNIDNGE